MAFELHKETCFGFKLHTWGLGSYINGLGLAVATQWLYSGTQGNKLCIEVVSQVIDQCYLVALLLH